MAIEKVIKIKVDNTDAIKGVEQVDKSIDKADESTENLTDSLGGMGGAAVSSFKSLSKGIRTAVTGFKTLKGAIIGTGIGALLIALISLKEAFTSSEEGQNKFAKIMGVIGSVVGNVSDALSTFGMFIIDLFSGGGEAMSSLKSFGKSIFDVVGLPIKNLIDTVKTLGKVLGALFSGDVSGAFDALNEGVEDIKGNFVEAGEAITGAKDALIEFGREALREAQIAADIADQRAKADKIERGLIVERAKANQEIADLRFKAEQRNTFTAKERVAFLQEAGKIEDEITAKEIEAARIRLETKKAENELNNSTKDDLDEVAELEAVLIELDTKRLNSKKRLQTSIITFQNEEIAGNKAIADAKQKDIDDEAKTQQDAADKRLEFQEKQDEALRDLNAKTREEKLRLQQERDLEDLENLIGTEEEKQEARMSLAILHFEQDEALKEELAEQERENKKERDAKKLDDDKKLADEQIALKNKVTQSSLQALDIAADLAGKDTAIGKAALLAKQAIATKELLIDLGAIRSKATRTLAESTMDGTKSTSSVATGLAATLSLGFPAAIPALVGYAAAAVGIVTGVVGAVKNSKKTAQKYGASGGGGDAPAPKVSAPSFNLVQGTGSNQIAEGIESQQDPIRAVVVSGDVTTSQSVDRNIVSESSI